MKAIVFIGTQKSGSSREAIRASEDLGFYTVLLTDRATFIEKRTEFPDVHLMQLCNLKDIEALKMAIKGLLLRAIDICAIVSFTDPYCHTACLLAEEFGVNRYSTEAIEKMEDKILTRQVLLHSSYNPFFLSLSDNTKLSKKEIEKLVPAIMKSPNSAGSKDVFKINTYKDFKHYKDLLLRKYPNVPVLVEEFLDGPQYLVEAVVYQKELHIIAVIKQEITFNKRFIITGYSLMIDMPENFYEHLKSAVESIVKLHGMESGPCHFEMRYVNNQWKIIEINPRISGGGMNKLIQIGFGINLVEETLKIALGQEPYLQPRFKNHSFAQYITISETGILEKVTGRNKAYKCPGVKDVYIKPRKGSLLTPAFSMGNRYAYVIATGHSEQEARENAKYAASLIKFHLLPPLNQSELSLTEDRNPNTVDCIINNIKKYKSYLTRSGRTVKTVDRYVNYAKEYLIWTKDYIGEICSDLDIDIIDKYKAYLLQTKQNSKKTIDNKMSALRSYKEFLICEGMKDGVLRYRGLIEYIKDDNNSVSKDVNSIKGRQQSIYEVLISITP